MNNLTQIEIEEQLSEAIPHGIRSEIAGLAHIYPSVFYGWLNPDDERKSPWYTVLAVQAEMDENFPDAGEKAWRAMNRLREVGRSGIDVGSGDDLPKMLLTDVGDLANAIREISKDIADGVVSEKEAQRLIETMSRIKDDAAAAIGRLVKHRAGLRSGLRSVGGKKI
jgi:hypothetical protein